MFRPKWKVISTLVKVASGSTGQYLIASASWIFMMYILGHIGKDTVAGYTIAIRLVMFSILPSWGMANAASTLVGQNLGAGQPDRAEKSAWRAGYFNMIFTGVVSLISLVFAPFFIGLFTKDPAVASSGVMALRIIAGGYVLYGWGMIVTQAINGAGDTFTPTMLNIVFFWLVETPLAYLLALRLEWGQSGVYWSIVIAESLMTVAAIRVFRRGKWKKAVV
jgi:Na+-driven multidrug efflux pump